MDWIVCHTPTSRNLFLDTRPPSRNTSASAGVLACTGNSFVRSFVMPWLGITREFKNPRHFVGVLGFWKDRSINQMISVQLISESF